MAIHEIIIGRKASLPDPGGNEVSAEIERSTGQRIPVIKQRVERVDSEMSPDRFKEFVDLALLDPITEEVVDPEDLPDGVSAVEVSYLNVMSEPGSRTRVEVGQQNGFPISAARESQRYLISSTQGDAERIALELLVNPNTQQIVKRKPEQLTVASERGLVKAVNISEMNDRELVAYSVQNSLHLDLSELNVVRSEATRLGRPLTDVEVEHIAAAWSEHCVHKTFKADIIVNGIKKDPLFSRIKTHSENNFGELVATAFDDNSGGIYFYEREDGSGRDVVVFKFETHNSPSALDPVGGAATGSGGVFRDIAGTMGADVILSTDIFGIAPADIDPSKIPAKAIRPDKMLRGLVAGVRDYGNPMGIPTSNGSLHYDDDFIAKPTVLVGAYGIVPEENVKKGQPEVNDRVVVIGGRVGRDGIHGATVSSARMTDETPEKDSSMVQVGDPIQEKKVFDAIKEARKKGIFRAITDLGAAGLGSAVGEMGSTIGVSVDISTVPLKYEGLSPREIWISESQERMLLSIPPDVMEEFYAICERHDVEATDLGYFDGSDRLTVKYGEETVIDLDYDFLNNGLPKRELVADYKKELHEEHEIPEPQSLEEWDTLLKRVLAHGDVCSKEPIIEQYDTTVQGTSALPPLGGVHFDAPNDAVVITPRLGSRRGMVASHGMNPALNRIDPARGTRWAITEAISNLVAVGGNFREMGLGGNYVTGEPDPQIMGILDIMVDSSTGFQESLGIPTVTGKDSLSSTYESPDGTKKDVPPVLCVSTIGRIPDVKDTVSTDFKKEGSTIVLVGKSHEAMGGSVYYKLNNMLGNEVPDVDEKVLPRVFDVIQTGIRAGGITACHDTSEGGTIIAAIEMAFGADCGVELEIDTNERMDFKLLNETVGRFVVELESSEMVEELFGDVPHLVLGKTTADKRIRVNNKGQQIINSDLDELKAAWKEPMRTLFH